MVSTFRHWHTETRLKLPDSFPKESGARETRFIADLNKVFAISMDISAITEQYAGDKSWDSWDINHE